MQVHSNETVFVITKKYLEKCERNHWDKNCAFCGKEFIAGHVCHSKFNGIKYKKRHIACAVRIGLVTIGDYEIAVVGYASMNKLDLNAPRPEISTNKQPVPHSIPSGTRQL